MSAQKKEIVKYGSMYELISKQNIYQLYVNFSVVKWTMFHVIMLE